MAIKYDMAVGIKKGHKVTKIENPKKNKANRMKGRNTKKNKFVRDLVREIVGLSPYEKRCQELLRVSREKRALKFCKKRLGAHTRGKKKREEMQAILNAIRKAAKEHEHEEEAA
ncbi:hypothetical protein LOTGIDRAFT_192827 [Lottia gigantea]|uniref:Large ribosomal subunit protein eL36 n=1 Tax=Lottia gigantea TaxID=225164 RepID=V3ZYY6_LOTGI|nr:hypothetical protein LOTGIDRAFT_192827 [Lottia gigantea]ESO89612.1 hypothetical protein LOTGIDRAFT_192827 [Lottia gigantea]